jgi:hypothetical protein
MTVGGLVDTVFRFNRLCECHLYTAPRNKALEVLDAIKLFIDIRGCVYVLGLDATAVERAVSAKYKDDETAQKEYIHKIIQIPFHLPPLTRDEITHFIHKVAQGLPDDRCREVFVEGLPFNLRMIKRTINVFLLLWSLASIRQGVMDLIIPVLLSKVVVIQQSYPDLYFLLQKYPTLLVELEQFFREVQEREEGEQDEEDMELTPRH